MLLAQVQTLHLLLDSNQAVLMTRHALPTLQPANDWRPCGHSITVARYCHNKLMQNICLGW